MCQAITECGHEVELLAPKRTLPDELGHMDIRDHYGLRVEFPIRRVIWPPVMGGHLYGLRSALYSLQAQPDLIFARHLPGATIAGLMGLPVICELHDMPGGNTGPLYLSLLGKSRGLRKIVAITEALRRDLICKYPRLHLESEICVFPDGVDIRMFNDLPDTRAARQELGIAQDGWLAGYAGHFYPGKGARLVLRVAYKCPDINFLMVGGEPDTIASFQKELERRKIGNVILAGFVPNRTLPNYLAACDILLLPQHRSVEGSGGREIGSYSSPMKLFEYMASGKAIISSDLPVLREILDNRIARLVPSSDVDAWANSIRELCNSPSLRRSLGREARRRSVDYSWTRRVEKMLLSGGINVQDGRIECH